jgi:predicted nucleic acid-binding protein
MITWALDTNIVSYFLKQEKTILEKIRAETNKGNQFVIPPTVYFEIRNWLIKNNSKKKIISFEKMYEDQGIGIIDKNVLDIASSVKITLQNKGITIGDSDIFIAAYCIKHNLPLVTHNTKHFENIDALKIVNWIG